MKRSIALVFSLFIIMWVSAQGFPDAQKQPKMKEQRHNQKKYAKRAHRRHVKRGTAYMERNSAVDQSTPVCILTGSRTAANIA